MNQLAETILWAPAPDRLRLAENEVHVWAAALDVPADILDTLSTALSISEKERAQRFKFEHHGNRFIAGRGLLRVILGCYLKTGPEKLVLNYSPKGKPQLDSEFADAGIYFNLAHSENLALFAVTRVAPVGVDVECVRSIKEMEELVSRFFSPRENESFQKLTANEKPTAFFNLWTRKEALLKATGEGIAGGLNKTEVSFLPNELPRVVAISDDSQKAAQWSLHDASPTSGFIGSVAVQAANVSVQKWKWLLPESNPLP